MLRKIATVELTGVHKVKFQCNERNAQGRSDLVTRKPEDESSAFAHPDLVAAFDALRIHLAVRSEEGDYTEFEDHPDKLDIFVVNKISISGKDEHEGVTLSGYKKLKDGQVLPLEPPFIKFSSAHSNYPYCESLHESIFVLLSETDQYENGKVGPNTQMSLSFDEPSEAVEEKPKRARKSKARQILEENLPEGVTVSVE